MRFTNKNNSADYVDVNLKQYSISNNMELYADGATYVDAGNYTINVSNQMGSIEVLLDAASGNGAPEAPPWRSRTGYPARTPCQAPLPYNPSGYRSP